MEPSLTFIDYFRTSGLQPSISDIRQFFQLLARVVKEAFGAQLVTIWDNNVYGECLVLLGSDPERDPERDHFTIPTDLSFTGLAIERCEVTEFLHLDKTIGQRRFINPSTALEYNLTYMVSIPVFNTFDPRLVSFVIDVFFDSIRPNFNKKRDDVDGLVRFLGLSLDYLLYRIEDTIRYNVEAIIPKASGISALFDGIFPELKRLTQCTSASLFRFDPSEHLLVLERSSDSATGSTEVHLHADPIGAGANLNNLLYRECITKKRAFMLSEPISAATASQGVEYERCALMATPILSGAGDIVGILLCRETLGESFGRSFSSLDLYALEAFARAIGPSTERFIRIRESPLLMSVMKDVSSAVIGADQLDVILQQIIKALVTSMNAAVGSIYLSEEANGKKKLVMRAATGVHEPLIREAEYEIGEGTTGDIATGKILNYKTIEERHTNHARIGKYDYEDRIPEEYKSFPAFLGVPIQMGNEILGVWKLEYLRPSNKHPDPYFTDEDVQMAKVLSSFLAYVIKNARYKEAKSRQFKLFARSSLKIEEAEEEQDAILAIMTALEDAGWKEAMLSLYHSSSKQIRGHIASGRRWSKIVDHSKSDIESNDIRAIVLRTNKPEFIPDSAQDVRCNPALVKLANVKAQYVLPLRLADGLIGTLQVDVGNRSSIDDDDALILQAFASHLAIAISRIRNIEKSLELTSQVMSGSRFIVAETLSSMAVHSLNHQMGKILGGLRKDLKRKEIKERRELLEMLTDWEDKLVAGKRDLENALQIVRAEGLSPQPDKPTDLHPLIQESIDTWIALLKENNCTVHTSLEADNSLCTFPAHAFREILSVFLVNAVQAYAKTIAIKTYNQCAVESPPLNFINKAFCLECSDDGVGLITDKPDEIFSTSYTTKSEKFGTGLGLFIARQLARQGGGDLTVIYPNPKPKGATFLLLLPVE